VMPKKAEAVVFAQLNKTKTEWTRKASAPVPGPASWNVRKSADKVVTLLHVESDGDELATPAAILLVVLRRIEGTKKALEARFERSTDRQIVDNVSVFLKHHNTKRRRSGAF
jgi:hypothetical protein